MDEKGRWAVGMDSIRCRFRHVDRYRLVMTIELRTKRADYPNILALGTGSTYLMEEPYAGNPPVRICAGECCERGNPISMLSTATGPPANVFCSIVYLFLATR